MRYVLFFLFSAWATIQVCRAESALYALGKAYNDEYREYRKMGTEAILTPGLINDVRSKTYERFRELDQKEWKQRSGEFVRTALKMGLSFEDDFSKELQKNPGLADAKDPDDSEVLTDSKNSQKSPPSPNRALASVASASEPKPSEKVSKRTGGTGEVGEAGGAVPITFSHSK